MMGQRAHLRIFGGRGGAEHLGMNGDVISCFARLIYSKKFGMYVLYLLHMYSHIRFSNI